MFQPMSCTSNPNGKKTITCRSNLKGDQYYFIHVKLCEDICVIYVDIEIYIQQNRFNKV